MCVTSQQSQTGAQPINEDTIIGHINIFLLHWGGMFKHASGSMRHIANDHPGHLIVGWCKAGKPKSQHSNAVKYGALGVGDLHVTLIRAHKKRHLQFPF